MSGNITSAGIPPIILQELHLNGFRVHRLDPSATGEASRARRDFYKMGLFNGRMTIQRGGKLLTIDGNALFFVNPRVPHHIVERAPENSGFACMFTEAFIKRTEIIRNSPLFHAEDDPVVPLNQGQADFMAGIFQKMIAVQEGEYARKGELIRNCIELIVHEALQIKPSADSSALRNGAARITHLFIDLLERQFPIERSTDTLRLRTPQDFAQGISVHVNYLNRSVRTVTGKPTSWHIAERIINEAKALLEHTDWSVSEIAYSLGFEYPSYFNNYFKRLTGSTPLSFRR